MLLKQNFDTFKRPNEGPLYVWSALNLLFTPDVLISVAWLQNLYQMAIEDLRTIPSLDQYNDLDLIKFAKQMGLDPRKIVVNEVPQMKNFASSCTLSHDILIIDPDEKQKYENRPEIKKFIFGHEFAHMFNKDCKKSIWFNIFLPPITHVFFTTLNKLTQKSLNVLAISANIDVTMLKTIARNLLQSFFIRSAFINAQLRLTYDRSKEKSADLLAATKLKCAQGGIDFMKEADEKLNQYSPFIKSMIERADNHPSSQERIAYLTPIAQEQD